MNIEKNHYSQYDFSEQIDLMQAQFAINVIDNAFSSGAEGWRQAYQVIKNLSHSESLQKVLMGISLKSFGRRRFWLYFLQRRYDVLLLLLEFINARLRRQ